MGIESIPHKSGAGRAKIVCDDCGRDEVIPCAYVGNSNAASDNSRPKVSQARAKAMAMNWSYVKNKLRCPACEAKRKTKNLKDTKPMTEKKTNVAPIRKPTGKQERLIILALEDAYDDEAKRYRGDATDRSVAESLSDGIMPGWVADTRERLFGPAGNEEADNLREAITSLERETKALIQKFGEEQQAKIDALLARLDRVVKAHDKRVG